MDSLLKNYLLYTKGLTESRTGILDLTPDICALALKLPSKPDIEKLKTVLIYDESNPEKNGFLCDYLLKIIKGKRNDDMGLFVDLGFETNFDIREK